MASVTATLTDGTLVLADGTRIMPSGKARSEGVYYVRQWADLELEEKERVLTAYEILNSRAADAYITEGTTASVRQSVWRHYWNCRNYILGQLVVMPTRATRRERILKTKGIDY